jgi:hypothetical protein
VVAELTLENRLLTKSAIAAGEDCIATVFKTCGRIARGVGTGSGNDILRTRCNAKRKFRADDIGDCLAISLMRYGRRHSEKEGVIDLSIGNHTMLFNIVNRDNGSVYDVGSDLFSRLG